jgi:hypothetical protein
MAATAIVPFRVSLFLNSRWSPYDVAQLPRACATVLTLRSPTRQKGFDQPGCVCPVCVNCRAQPDADAG